MNAPRTRGTIALLEENCTVCMLCVRECPDWCITIEAHGEKREPPGGGRPRQQNLLDRFAIDFGLCFYCGICVDVCPFDALFWAPEPTAPATSRAGLVQERDLLRMALAAVPPPPPHDPRGEEAKELVAARSSGPAPARIVGVPSDLSGTGGDTPGVDPVTGPDRGPGG